MFCVWRAPARCVSRRGAYMNPLGLATTRRQRQEFQQVNGADKTIILSGHPDNLTGIQTCMTHRRALHFRRSWGRVCRCTQRKTQLHKTHHLRWLLRCNCMRIHTCIQESFEDSIQTFGGKQTPSQKPRVLARLKCSVITDRIESGIHVLIKRRNRFACKGLGSRPSSKVPLSSAKSPSVSNVWNVKPLSTRYGFKSCDGALAEGAIDISKCQVVRRLVCS